MLEKAVKNSLRDYLTQLGAYQYWPVPMGLGAKTVDCLFCYKGKFFAVETKRPGVNDPTSRQRLTITAVKESGGWACIENNPALPAVRTMIINALLPH